MISFYSSLRVNKLYRVCVCVMLCVQAHVHACAHARMHTTDFLYTIICCSAPRLVSTAWLLWLLLQYTRVSIVYWRQFLVDSFRYVPKSDIPGQAIVGLLLNWLELLFILLLLFEHPYLFPQWPHSFTFPTTECNDSFLHTQQSLFSW